MYISPILYPDPLTLTDCFIKVDNQALLTPLLERRTKLLLQSAGILPSFDIETPP